MQQLLSNLGGGSWAPGAEQQIKHSKKLEKIKNTFSSMANKNFLIISSLIIKPNGGFLTPETEKPEK